MSHNITSRDNLVLAGKPAWHGLGLVVENAPTPQEALRLAKLDWRVVEEPLYRRHVVNADAIASVEVATHKAIVREDTGEQLGVLGIDWTPVQNSELAELAESVNQDGIVKVESAGSLGAGGKVWFLLRGDSIYTRKADETIPYVLLSNGHDGTLSLTARATSVRVVCQNTLNLALGQSTEKQVRYVHSKGIKSALPALRDAIKLFGKAREEYLLATQALSDKALSLDEVRSFFLDVYTKTLGLEIPTVEQANADAGRARARRNAIERVGAWKANFNTELERGSGLTAWAAFNAVTEEFASRERGPKGAELFGAPAQRRRDVFKAALALVR